MTLIALRGTWKLVFECTQVAASAYYINTHERLKVTVYELQRYINNETATEIMCFRDCFETTKRPLYELSRQTTTGVFRISIER